ncbi:hypothetical protein KIN20_011118 [Parelaphostrongylus tenuis]|uniref:Uncharacterized protein n=1 Tax=Parelaphostrongylus tenuis TaxID=148309 RepID=A0AAD5MUY9_PARTN|nr:hypothetical protein KIN20_011118 [Parelaphostrongylus tenuis]
MNILIAMIGQPTGPLIILLLVTIPTILGCGVLPPGQASTRIFTVSGFTLPVAMVYTGKPAVSAQFTSIANSEAAARRFVQRLVKQTVFDVLERQGRSALLPDAVISSILDQLNVTAIYRPINCNMVVSPGAMLMPANSPACITVDNTVTGICTVMGPDQKMCTAGEDMVTIAPVPPTSLTIGGTISTTNIIMANWSREMWQSVVNRAIRMLASDPLGSNFASATAVVSGIE